VKIRARLYVRVLPFWAPCIAARDVFATEEFAIQAIVHNLRNSLGLTEKQFWVEFK
jgi:hypothetical protein